MITAKQVVPNEFWVIRDEQQKIGNFRRSQTETGYNVMLKNKTFHVRNITDINKDLGIDFDNTIPVVPDQDPNLVHGYQTDCNTVYNAVWNVKRQIPMFTKEPRSRSWYAAGWFQIYNHRGTQLHFCPKLIVLDRYRHIGPFHSKEELYQDVMPILSKKMVDKT